MAKGIQDTREFIAKLEAAGELVRIKKEVDWDVEAGAILRRGAELRAPAALMENVKDYPGWRLGGNFLASYRRYAIALGLDPDTPVPEIQDEFERRIENPIKPEIVSEAPCQENVIEEKDVDLFMLPAPMIHEGDGGRYLGTYDLEVEKDPDTGWVNWGMYRRMIHDERHLGGFVWPHQDIGKIFYEKYAPRGEGMPFALVLTPGPIGAIVAATSFGVEVSEPEMAGALLGEPYKLVRCKTVPLEVPAEAEVVIEGEIIPGLTVEEGPFGEYTGFITSDRMPRNVFKVKCITYRNNAILGIANMGLPVDDCDIIWAIGFAVRVRRALRKEGIPVKGVNWIPEGSGQLCIVGLERIPYANIASQIADIVFGTRGPHVYVHHLIIVGPECDPFNLMEVIHDFANCCHPKRIQIRRDEVSNPLIPFLDFEERVWSRGAKAVYDCTWPLWWDPKIEVPSRAGFKFIYSKEIQEKVENNWKEYGF